MAHQNDVSIQNNSNFVCSTHPVFQHSHQRNIGIVPCQCVFSCHLEKIEASLLEKKPRLPAKVLAFRIELIDSPYALSID